MRCGQTEAPFALPVSSHKAKRDSCLVKVNFPFKQTALQTAGKAVTSEPPRCLAESLGPLTSCNYCLEHHTAVASAGAVRTEVKCKQRGGLDEPLTLLANYSCLWSAIGCLEGEKWVWSETSLRANYSKSNFVVMFSLHIFIENRDLLRICRIKLASIMIVDW